MGAAQVAEPAPRASPERAQLGSFCRRRRLADAPARHDHEAEPREEEEPPQLVSGTVSTSLPNASPSPSRL